VGSFEGFGAKALPFFKALKFHQSRDWFEENRALYEDDVLKPFIALLDDLSADFARGKLPLRADGRKSIFRIHRDVRFAKDKSPYKTHAGAVMTRSGTKGEQGLLYIHIDPEGPFMAAGFYMPEPADLARLRKAIKAEPKGFGRMTAALKKGGLELSNWSQLSRIPRGFEDLKDGPLDGPIRLKSFIVEEKLPMKMVTRPELVGTVADFAKRSRPLLDFGWKALDGQA
jgi:uncharacterized protein (TIGR02453 family)